MHLNWLPWKYVVRRVARARGFIDPITVLSRLHQFAEPSEVAAPLELLRAGVVFHARGLMNSGVIQHNLDWIWPYWVERQFDPRDIAFLPRAFAITHVNLTHRNWTATGIPGCEHLPIVDPRGLLTPFWDGWSLDGWVFSNDGERLIPSREPAVEQRLDMTDGISVVTQSESTRLQLRSVADVAQQDDGTIVARQRWTATAKTPAQLVLSVRPYNPEGVSFVHDIQLQDDRRSWQVGESGRVFLSQPADAHFISDYKRGDVSALIGKEQGRCISCSVGMATAAAVFEIKPDQPKVVELVVPLADQHHSHWLFLQNKLDRKVARVNVAGRATASLSGEVQTSTWADELGGLAKLQVPDQHFVELHEAALRTLVLHTPGEVYPGPYTYKRFWVRDTAFILNAALCIGMHARVTRALPHLFSRQDKRGYFHSQEGEWDANGQALWLMNRYCELTNQPPPEQWRSIVQRAADWILQKRIPADSQHPASGLLPAGFSAEHLGPNDYYYWDDFWSVAGLRSAACLIRSLENTEFACRLEKESHELLAAIDRSLLRTDNMRSRYAFPAAPERRMDAGAIGSIVASYPLQLVAPDDARLQGTIDFLLDNCLVKGGFFQDMIHSGINPYLTLHIAQAMLRQHHAAWFDLLNSVAELASPTGQWPEAIHPRTLGGCMGDGQHAWAAAEWLMAIRNMFVREEGDTLIIASGVPARWHNSGQTLSYGPTWTPWGNLRLKIESDNDTARVSWQALWHSRPRAFQIAMSCYREEEVDMSASEGCITIAAVDSYSRPVR